MAVSSEVQPLDVGRAYNLAIALLARREYSARELAGRLADKGATQPVIDAVLARLGAERLQSDVRFTEAYIRQRSARGYGPLRIRMELRERGIEDPLIAESLRRAEGEGEVDWYELAAAAYRKKYGERPIEDIRERAKRTRFLQYRGFDQQQVAAAIESE